MLERGLHGDAARSVQAQPEIAVAPRSPHIEAGARMLEVQLHLNRGVFEDERCRLHQDGLAGPQLAHKHVAGGVQQQQARAFAPQKNDP